MALTPVLAKLSISPESSDGFASVGTILPKEEATLLPGGLFVFPESFGESVFDPERDIKKPISKEEFGLSKAARHSSMTRSYRVC